MRTLPIVNGKTILACGVLAVFVSCTGLTVWFCSDDPPRQNPVASRENPLGPPSAGLGDSARASEGAFVAERQWDGVLAPFQAAQAMTNPTEQADEFERLMQNITAEMAADLLPSMSAADLKSEVARRLFDHWATTCPRDALKWAQALPDLETGQSFMVLAALRWTNNDLAQASTWARSLPDGDFRTEIMASVGSEAIRSAPLEALRLGVELPKGEKQADLLRRAAAEWALTDRDSALEWAKQIADENLRQLVIGQMVATSANQDPAEAANNALQEMVPSAEQDRAVVTIIQHWVQVDAEGASAWVGQFPDDRLGQDAIGNLVNLWAGQDLVASGNWLSSLPPSALQAAGVLAYSSVLKRTDPKLAQRWASSVTDSTDQ